LSVRIERSVNRPALFRIRMNEMLAGVVKKASPQAGRLRTLAGNAAPV
jgi:hypothetical protein